MVLFRLNEPPGYDVSVLIYVSRLMKYYIILESVLQIWNPLCFPLQINSKCNTPSLDILLIATQLYLEFLVEVLS